MKRGIFFTFLSMLFAALFLSVALNETNTLKSRPVSATIAVSSTNAFVNSLEETYLERILRVAGARTILAIICEENSSGKFIVNFTENAKSLAINGTFNSLQWANSQCQTKYLQNYSLNFNKKQIELIAKENMSVDANITINDVSFFQESPWSVNVVANFSLDIKNSAASWKRTSLINSSFGIDYFYDPLFLVYTREKYPHRFMIRQKKIDLEFSAAEFLDHVENMTYYQNPMAPSFLSRLQNSSDASSCCGISTILNLGKFSQATKDAYNENTSYVDFMFFNQTNANCASFGTIYNLSGISEKYSNLKLDFYHISAYNLSSKAEIVCQKTP